jgi:hypothetical protein
MTCGRQCRYSAFGHSDAAKRISDIAITGWVAHGWDGFVGHWMSFRLEDGQSDKALYPRKADAVKHVPNEFHYMFIVMHVGGMSPCEAEIMLDFHRKAYDAGFRLADPDVKTGGPDLIPRIGTPEIASQIQALEGN